MTNTRSIVKRRNGDFMTPFDSIFDKVFNESFPMLKDEIGVSPFNSTSYPKCDIVEYEDRYEVVADIPGLSKDQVKVELDDGILTIKGEKSDREVIKDGGKSIRREIKQSSFSRSFTLDDSNIESDELKATFNDSLLTIKLPKSDPDSEHKKREVKIE